MRMINCTWEYIIVIISIGEPIKSLSKCTINSIKYYSKK